MGVGGYVFGEGVRFLLWSTVSGGGGKRGGGKRSEIVI